MTASINSQAYIFLCSVIGGVAIAIVFDVFRILRKAIKTSNFITFIEDILFWMFVAIIMFSTVYYSNEGELRSYIFLGALLGAVFYALLLSRAVMNSSLLIIKIITTAIKMILFVIFFPFRVIIKLFAVPYRAIVRLSGKAFKNIRRVGRNRLSKTSIWNRALKNIRKKI